MKKRLLGLLLVLTMIIGFIPLSSNAAETASSLGVNDTVRGNLTTNQKAALYQISLPSAGNLQISVTAFFNQYNIKIKNLNGDVLWSDGRWWDENIGFSSLRESLNLDKGVYYLQITGSYSSSVGGFEISTEFQSANTNHSEPNNSIAQATSIEIGSEVRGQIAINDRNDVFRISVPKDGRLNLDFISQIVNTYNIYLYDSSGVKVWEKVGQSIDSGSGMSSNKYQLDLLSGVYFISVTGKYSSDSGPYRFTSSFNSANTNVSEPNNSIAQATPVSYERQVIGQIALNDEYDFYQFQTASDEWVLEFTTYMPRCSIYTYNAQGNEIDCMKRQEWDESAGHKTYTIKFVDDYQAGQTYYLKVERYYGDTGNYSFTIKDPSGTVPTPHPTPYPGTPFTDIADHWGKESIKWAYTKNLFSGTSADKFSPNNSMSRGMLATVLYRLKGSPSVSGDSGFWDVSASQYYAKPIKWASDNKIVSGMGGGSFAPDSSITREQLAVMLYNYERKYGNPSGQGDLSQFTDGSNISSWAQDAVRWAVSRGILTGKGDGRLDPKGNATRAEVASMLYRFAN